MYKFMAHLLSDFDPIRTEEILENSTHEEIMDAYRSKTIILPDKSDI